MVKACSWNLAGVGSDTIMSGGRTKRALVMNEMRALRCDVYLAQETHCGSYETADEWQIEWKGLAYFTEHSTSRGGAAILFRAGLTPTILGVDICPAGHSVKVKCEIAGTVYTLVSVYAPSDPAERKRFFRTKLAGLLEGENLIVGG